MTSRARADDAEIAYVAEGAGPPVLCLQGVGVIGEGWRPQMDALSPRFRTIAPDNRGIGGSGPGRPPLTIEKMARDALAVMDAEGEARFHVIGHSMGGLIAQQLAIAAPSRVISLALVCTFPDGRNATAFSLRLMTLGLRTRLGTRAMRRAGMLRLIMPEAYLRTVDRHRLAADLSRLFGRDLADQPPIVAAQLGAMKRYGAVRRPVDLPGTPTLVVSGAHDPIAPPTFGRALAAAIPGARYVEFAEAGHALPIQCAAELNALLLEHLDGAATRSRQVSA
jgi:3-oxoadipate enol-lactonase